MPRRTLILLRHAEAEAARPGEEDRERALTARGRRQAESVGRALAVEGIVPELAMASDARRAIETMIHVVRQAIPPPCELVVPELYGADEYELSSSIRRSGGTADTLLIIGHNPSIENCAGSMAGRGDARAASRLDIGFPPAALAVFDVHAPKWADFDPINVEIRRFLVPEED